MIVLGINDTHDASACLVRDGKVIDIVSEERLNRYKGISSLPIKAIQYILKKNKLDKRNIDHVSVANTNLNHMNLWNVNCQFKLKDHIKLQEKLYYKNIYEKRKIKLKKIFPNYKTVCKMGYSVDNIPFITSDEASKKDLKKINDIRLNSISKLLKIDKSKISFHDHHRCHTFYGFYTNPMKSNLTAVLTSDGGGDGVYNTVNIFKNGKFISINKSKNSWIGKIYSNTTLILGMNPFRHAYKVMGLAPYTQKSNYKEILNFFLKSLKVKNLDFKINKEIKDKYFYFKKNLNGYRFDNIAGALQNFTEIRLKEWFNNVSKKFKVKNFVFTGGVANNVKVNKFLAEQKFVNKLWVPPGPGDESLSLGAAYSYLYNFLGYKKCLNYIKVVENAYLGPSVSKSSIDLFKKNKLIKKNFKLIYDKNYNHVAKSIKEGEIIFVCIGRQEFGQRALGHRSIICDPSKLELVKKINSSIKMRDFWMPFTPSILDKKLKKYIKYNKKLNYNYMTSCVEATEIGKLHLKAAIHPGDYTVRPQKVTRASCPKYYKLIEQFSKISGIGAVLNTSLNMHEYPIVTYPNDIIKEIILNSKNLNYSILIEDHFFKRKKS